MIEVTTPRTIAREPMIISSSLGTITLVANDVIWKERKERTRQRESRTIRLIESFIFPPASHTAFSFQVNARFDVDRKFRPSRGALLRLRGFESVTIIESTRTARFALRWRQFSDTPGRFIQVESAADRDTSATAVPRTPLSTKPGLLNPGY